MMSMIETVQRLRARLPELLWKLNKHHILFHSSQLPKGLFHQILEMSPQSCIEEIQADLHALERREEDESGRFLARKVNQKVTVLVRLCQLQAEKPLSPPLDLLEAMSTHQQWVVALEKDVMHLRAQHQALARALQECSSLCTPEALLTLQAELGEAARRLTLAEEAMGRALLHVL